MENCERFKNIIPEDKRRRELRRFLACPVHKVSCHNFEAEYWEVYSDYMANSAGHGKRSWSVR